MKFSLTQTASKTGFLKSKDQTPLFFRQYLVKAPKASVFLVHGFGEYGGRYGHVIDRLTKEGFEVFSVDLRGHGYSEGKRGDIDDFRRYEEDVVAGLEFAFSKKNASNKLFVLAHSMGALISLKVVSHTLFPLDGMVLSCPLFGLATPVPTWKKWAVFSMASLLPKTPLSAGIKGNQLSSDRGIAKAYDADPLVLKSISARAFWEIFKGCQDVDAMASSMSLSFLMQIGGKDPVVDANASKRWFDQVNHQHVDATLKIYPEFLHEIYNEINRQVPIDDAVTWLNQRVS